jgi:uncharacterized membrane protein YGL010W
MVGLYESQVALLPSMGAEELYSCDTHVWFDSAEGLFVVGWLKASRLFEDIQ